MSQIEFIDKVMEFGTDQGRFQVLFAEHAAQYRIATERSDFAQLVAALATVWKRGAPARFTVQDTEIVAIGAGPG